MSSTTITYLKEDGSRVQIMNIDAERFERFCSPLRCNDSDTTEIDLFGGNYFHLRNYNSGLRNWYGNRLGETLQEDNNASTMRLLFNDMLHDENEAAGNSFALLLLRYIRESGAMRKVALWCFHDAIYEESVNALVRHILLAVAENTSIEECEIWMNMESFAETYAMLLQTTRSLKTMKITLGPVDDAPASSIELVAKAFGANRTLECLTFEQEYNNTTMESILLYMGSLQSLLFLELKCGVRASVATRRQSFARGVWIATSADPPTQ